MTPGTAKHKLEINKYPHFTQQKAEYEETKKKKKNPKVVHIRISDTGI